MNACAKLNSVLYRSLLNRIRENTIILSARQLNSSKSVSNDGLETESIRTEDATPPTQFNRSKLPIVTSRQLKHLHPKMSPKQAWLETLETSDDEKLGIIDLHPEIFAANPRIDMLHKNILWQQAYRRISYASTKSRAEVRGGGRKPWPQKGTGRARHGSIRSPLWVGGGVARGPRGPKSYFYMLPKHTRVYGLRVALSVKYAQNDLHIVDSLEIPTDDEKYIEDLVEKRYWGYSALFVDDTDFMPRNLSVALSKTPQFNLMPVYGLNVYSMLKHETLILTRAAVEKIEEKLLYQLHKTERDVKQDYTRGHRGSKWVEGKMKEKMTIPKD